MDLASLGFPELTGISAAMATFTVSAIDFIKRVIKEQNKIKWLKKIPTYFWYLLAIGIPVLICVLLNLDWLSRLAGDADVPSELESYGSAASGVLIGIGASGAYKTKEAAKSVLEGKGVKVSGSDSKKDETCAPSVTEAKTDTAPVGSVVAPPESFVGVTAEKETTTQNQTASITPTFSTENMPVSEQKDIMLLRRWGSATAPYPEFVALDGKLYMVEEPNAESLGLEERAAIGNRECSGCRTPDQPTGYVGTDRDF